MRLECACVSNSAHGLQALLSHTLKKLNLLPHPTPAAVLLRCTAAHDVYRYREVLQEDEFLVKRLRVAGPATGQPYKPSQRLECVKVARLLSISDDVRTVSRKQLQAAVAAGAELGPAAWDGKLPPSKLRTRIGGWRVLGEEQQQQQQQQQQRKKKGSSSSSSSSGDDADDEDGGSSSDEEFQEIVFENSTAGAAAAGSGSSNDGSNEQQQQQGVDPDHRFYSSSSDDEQQQGSAAGLKDYWDVLNERFNLGKVSHSYCITITNGFKHLYVFVLWS
jgi:hypothetical protein